MPTRQKGPIDPEYVKRLKSFVDSLYEEMDKLARKAPRDAMSDLAVTRANRAVREARSLMGQYDEYVADLPDFVPAGSNPEVRDAVLVLNEIKAGLSRLRTKFQLWKFD